MIPGKASGIHRHTCVTCEENVLYPRPCPYPCPRPVLVLVLSYGGYIRTVVGISSLFTYVVDRICHLAPRLYRYRRRYVNTIQRCNPEAA